MRGTRREIGVLHAVVDLAGKIAAEQIGELEIGAALAVLVAQRGLARGDDPAALLHIRAQLGALRIRQREDVRQNENAEAVRLLDQALVDHLERDAGFDQGLAIAVLGILHLRTVERLRPRRVDDRDAGKVFGIAEVFFVAPVPFVDFFDRRHPARIDHLAVELAHPGTEALRHAGVHPRSDFGTGLYGNPSSDRSRSRCRCRTSPRQGASPPRRAPAWHICRSSRAASGRCGPGGRW